jgi:hypothetical protein
MAMAETLFETLRNLPPNLQVVMLEPALELSDIPDKQKVLAKLAKVTGMDGAPPTPEQQQQQAQADAHQAAATDSLNAKAERDRAEADKARSSAQHTRVQAKGDALNVAGAVASSIPLAPTADRILSDPPVPGVPSAQPQ